MQYNDEQLNIIDAGINKNILVSAAAGSGKTTVLTERIVRKVADSESDISLSNILVMTFTIKATAEMKARIKQKLSDEVAKLKNSNTSKVLYESETIQNANIFTIDAFCKKLLEENYTLLDKDNSLFFDFDPSYRVGDANEMQVLNEEVLDELLEKEYINKEYKDLFDAYVDKSDETKLRKLFIDGISFLSSIPWPYEYLTKHIDKFDEYAKKAYDDYVLYCRGSLNDLKIKYKGYADTIISLKDLCKGVLDSGKSASGKALTTTAINKLNGVIEYCDVYLEYINYYCNVTLIGIDKDNMPIINENEYSSVLKMMEKTISFETDFPVKTIFGEGIDEEYLSLKKEVKTYAAKFRELGKIWNSFHVDNKLIYNNNDKIFLKLLREYYYNIVCEKKKRNLYEISDYASLALDILYDKKMNDNGEVIRVISRRAKDIGDRYKLIFVDEYQDTNFVQEKILAAISNNFENGNVFMVGDVKQSIYGFRKAEPSIFVDKYSDYKNGLGGINKTLSTNYRSTKEIIAYVNDLFSKTMTLSYGDIDYNDGNSLIPRDEERNRDYIDDNRVEIHVVSKNDTKVDVDEDKNNDDIEALDNTQEKKYSSVEVEADYVASLIEKLVCEKHYSYNKIVILLRSMKSKGKVYEEALRRHKIPAYAELKSGFFNTFEIKLMIDILSVIDNPLNSVALASVLSSSIYNFTNDEFAFLKIISNDVIKTICENIENNEITSNKQKGNDFDLEGTLEYIKKIKMSNSVIDKVEIENYNEKVIKYRIDEAKLLKKVDKYFADFNELRFKARYSNISDLIESIYETLNIKIIVSAMEGGKIRSANLNILYDFALQFENSSYVGLFNFNKYLEKIKEINNDRGQAKIYDENANVVRIMTLHSSKGLQFDTVFLCSAGTNYNFDDTKEESLYQTSEKYGISLDYYDNKWKSLSITPKKSLVSKMKLDGIKQEELRMFYVALTRAERKLYVVGSTVSTGDKAFLKSKLKKFLEEKNEGKNLGLSIKDSKSYLDILLSNYPLNDESFCKFVDVLWDVSDKRYEFEEIEFDKISNDVRDENVITKENSEYFDSLSYENIDRTLTDTYEYKEYQYLKPKLSVSSIKSLLSHDAINNDNVVDSNFIILDKTENNYDDARIEKDTEDSDELSGAELGTAYHRFMEFYDFEEANDTMVVDVAKINNFLSNKLGKEMKEAYINKKLYREHKFMKLFSQNEINHYLYKDEKRKIDTHSIYDEKEIVVQGIVDAFYIKKGEDGNDYIVLVDYKTDSIKSKINNREGFERELVNRYKVQLDIYGRVLEELSGIPVKEKFIYSFALDKDIKV